MSRARGVAFFLGLVLFGAVLPGMSAGPPATFWGDRDAYGLWLGPYTYDRMAMTVGSTAEGTVGLISHGGSVGCGPAYADDVGTFQVAKALSSAPEVLRVTLGADAHITLEGLAEGTAELSLVDAKGNELDHFSIPVRAVTTIGESLAEVGTDVLLEGGLTVDVLAPKVAGFDLAAVPRVDVVASGGLSVVDGDAVGRGQAQWLRGTAGWGHLALSTPGGARAERDLYVAAPSRVKQVTLRLEGAPRQVSGDWAVTVVSTATLDDGRKVMGPRCDYSVEGPSTTVKERAIDGLLVLERRADVWLADKGVYRITCTLGAGSATVVTERP